MQDDISRLRADRQQYEQDAALVPNYQPQTQPPGGGEITQVITAAQQAIAAARKRSSGAATSVANLVAQAKGYSGQADAACKNANG